MPKSHCCTRAFPVRLSPQSLCLRGCLLVHTYVGAGPLLRYLIFLWLLVACLGLLLVCVFTGTPEYMALEMYSGDGGSYTTAVDIYAFGRCVLEMITRQVREWWRVGNLPYACPQTGGGGRRLLSLPFPHQSVCSNLCSSSRLQRVVVRVLCVSAVGLLACVSYSGTLLGVCQRGPSHAQSAGGKAFAVLCWSACGLPRCALSGVFTSSVFCLCCVQLFVGCGWVVMSDGYVRHPRSNFVPSPFPVCCVCCSDPRQTRWPS